MTWGIVTLTANGLHLGLRVREVLQGEATLYAPEKVCHFYREKFIGRGLHPSSTSYSSNLSSIEMIKGPFKDFVKSIYPKHRYMVFIMAAGIVVRSLEGLLEHKSKDPGIMVMDEKGAFIVPILSGHMGGANEMAVMLGERLEATPVITTASDVQGKLAVDMLAEKLGSVFEDFRAATKVSGKIVNGEEVFLFTEIPLPQWVEKYFPVFHCTRENIRKEAAKHSGGKIILSHRRLKPTQGENPDDWIQLYPQCLIIGIGARKNISADHVRKSIEKVLEEFDYNPLSIKHFATVDVKEKEAGIIEGIKGYNRPLRIISREDIKAVEGKFQGSDFVKKTLGISAVAEPAAYCSSSKNGEFILGKRKIEGLTLALWKENDH